MRNSENGRCVKLQYPITVFCFFKEIRIENNDETAVYYKFIISECSRRFDSMERHPLRTRRTRNLANVFNLNRTVKTQGSFGWIDNWV